MSKVVRISNKQYKIIQSYAEPFKDSVKTALDRLFKRYDVQPTPELDNAKQEITNG